MVMVTYHAVFVWKAATFKQQKLLSDVGNKVPGYGLSLGLH